LAKTLLEIKWIGKKDSGVELDEIHIDVQTYGRHRTVSMIFVVIDAVRDVPDPHLVETELSGKQVIDGRVVRVIAYVREP
jgi:hypothetical protein